MMPLTAMDADRILIAEVLRQRRTEAAARYAGTHAPAIHEALIEAVDGLGSLLGGVERAIGAAVGVTGPAGRRWRPLLALAAAEACGGRAEDALPAAVAAELTHAASLVLDDLPCMDDTALRRGIAATHLQVGSAGAILVAIGLLGRAAEVLASSPAGAARSGAEWGRTIGLMGMSGGQAVDVATGGRVSGALRRLHREKTVALAVFALEAGARASGGGEAQVGAMRRFGSDLGWAYQLADDAADAQEDHEGGRTTSGRSPLRQCRRLLARAERRILADSSIDRSGAELLVALGLHVVCPLPHPAIDA